MTAVLAVAVLVSIAVGACIAAAISEGNRTPTPKPPSKGVHHE